MTFDLLEFKKTTDLTDTDPVEADIRFENYLEKYPSDYIAYAHYINNLITLGRLDEANDHYNYLECLTRRNKANLKEKKRVVLKDFLLYCKIRLLVYRHEYASLRIFLRDHRIELNCADIDASLVEIYMKKMQGRTPEFKAESYLMRQLVNYNYDMFRQHINNHIDNDIDVEHKNKNTLFSYNIDIDKIIAEVQKKLGDAPKLYKGLIDDTYIFKYDTCGKKGNQVQDYFCVVCFHDTKDIITMYPICNCTHDIYTDLNYLNKEDNSNYKRPSQLERFNRRYQKAIDSSKN